MVEVQHEASTKEEDLASADESYDYGDEMKSTRDRTGKQSWKPQLFVKDEVVRMQVDEGSKNRPVMNWRRFVVRAAKQDLSTGKWKYQLNLENEGVSDGPYAGREYFAEPKLKDL